MRAAVARFAAVALVLAAPAACAPVQGPLEPLAQAEAEPMPEPEPGGSWADLGRRLLAAGQPEQAEEAFIRSLAVEGITAAALNGAGVAAQNQGLLTEAVRYFERARTLAPDSVAVHNNLGAALYGLGELHAARKAFRNAFALSSGTSGEAQRNLGIVEIAIARAEAPEPEFSDSPHRLQRTGREHYKITVAPGTPTTAEEGEDGTGEAFRRMADGRAPGGSDRL